MSALAIGTTYTDSLPKIRSVCSRFARRYGGHVDDYIADAGALLMRAHAEHKPEEDWDSHLYRWIWFPLLDARRVELRRLSKREAIDPDTVPTGEGFDLNALLEDCSADAAHVLGLVFCPPAKLAREIKGKGGEPRNVRSSIRAWLDANGWDKDRVADAFAEIKAALP